MDMLENHFVWCSLPLLGGMLACSGHSGTTSASTSLANAASATTTDGSVALPACTWPASLDPTDAATDAASGQCMAARTYLSCQLSSDLFEDCASDNALQCPPTWAMASGSTSGSDAASDASFTCVNQCHASEYFVGCGGPGPGPWPDLPSGCRALLGAFGGGVTGCCPCGS